MGNYLPYTKREDEIIIIMHKANFAPKEICKVLIDRTPDQIKDRGYRLGLKWTREAEIDEAMFNKLMKVKT